MDLGDKDFTLVWPQELFVWEARRIAKITKGLPNAVDALLSEAFKDADVKELLVVTWNVFTSPMDTGAKADLKARELLNLLIGPDSPIRPYRRPQYWLERRGVADGAGASSKPMRTAFLELIEEMSEQGYFPKALPRGCVDVPGSWNSDPSSEISRAIRAEVQWPGNFQPSKVPISDAELYSVIEFFHDQASCDVQGRCFMNRV